MLVDKLKEEISELRRCEMLAKVCVDNPAKVSGFKKHVALRGLILH